MIIVETSLVYSENSKCANHHCGATAVRVYKNCDGSKAWKTFECGVCGSTRTPHDYSNCPEQLQPDAVGNLPCDNGSCSKCIT